MNQLRYSYLKIENFSTPTSSPTTPSGTNPSGTTPSGTNPSRTTPLSCATGFVPGTGTYSKPSTLNIHNGSGWASQDGKLWCPKTSCYNETTKYCNLPIYVTTPPGTTPPGTTPVGTTPPGTTPPKTTPVVTTPVVTTPVVTTPVVTKPVVTQPQKILGKPLSQKTQEGFFRIGLILLFSLMFFTTFNDLKDLGLF